MEKNEILVIYGREYKEMTKKLLEEADAAARIPSADTLIGIKPNLLAPISASDGATTHPEVAAGIIEYLRDHGFRNIVMLESSWVGDKTSDSLLVTGFDRLCEEYAIPFWDLQEDRGVPVDCAGMELHVCERAAQIGFLINVPVLKGHCQTRMTCALKNMKGLLPASEKRRFHRMGLHEPIGHLSAGITQGLIVVDSICPDLTFEDGGSPVQLDRIYLAQDPVLCDAFGAGLLGLHPEDVPYIGIAASSGAGSDDLSRAHVRVCEDLRTDKERENAADRSADWRRILRIAEMTDAVDTCSACYASLLPVLVQLDGEGLLDRLPDKLCIGQGYRGLSGTFGIGNCTCRFEHYLPGCPPSQEEVASWLRSVLT